MLSQRDSHRVLTCSLCSGSAQVSGVLCLFVCFCLDLWPLLPYLQFAGDALTLCHELRDDLGLFPQVLQLLRGNKKSAIGFIESQQKLQMLHTEMTAGQRREAKSKKLNPKKIRLASFRDSRGYIFILCFRTNTAQLRWSLRYCHAE